MSDKKKMVLMPLDEYEELTNTTSKKDGNTYWAEIILSFALGVLWAKIFDLLFQ